MRLHDKNPSGLTLPLLSPGSPWVTFFSANRALGVCHSQGLSRSLISKFRGFSMTIQGRKIIVVKKL